jgi:hypothetical protein
MTPEGTITRGILRELKEYGCYAWKNWSGPMSRRGISDIIGVLPDGRGLFVEVKRPGGKLTPMQRVFLDEVAKAGALAFTARSVEEVQAQLEIEGYRPPQRRLFGVGA